MLQRVYVGVTAGTWEQMIGCLRNSSDISTKLRSKVRTAKSSATRCQISEMSSASASFKSSGVVHNTYVL